MTGPCMCGDPYCGRCGHISKCPVCGKYPGEFCEEHDEDAPDAVMRSCGFHCQCTPEQLAEWEDRYIGQLEEEEE